MKIVLVGAGKVGYYLLKTLKDRGHKLSLIEQDKKRCYIVAEEMGILTINADGTNVSVLVDAGADTADVVAAVTGRDEVNLVICQIAKEQLGVKKVVARINNPKNRKIMQELGVDIAVSGTGLIADAIEQEIVYQHMRTLIRIKNSNINLIELTIEEGAYGCNKSVIELAEKFSRGIVFVSVIRGEEIILPHGLTILRAGDVVMAIVHPGKEEVFRQVLQGE